MDVEDNWSQSESYYEDDLSSDVYEQMYRINAINQVMRSRDAGIPRAPVDSHAEPAIHAGVYNLADPSRPQ